MNKYYILLLQLAIVIMVGCSSDSRYFDSENSRNNNGRGEDSPPTVVTESVAKAGEAIVFAGRVISQGGSTVTEWGICIDEKANPTLKVRDNSIDYNSFTVLVENLDNDKTYYYRAYAVNSAGTAYGKEYKFKPDTLIISENTVPIVTTSAVISGNIAINATGSITSDGGLSITERGFCYSTNPEFTIENSTKIAVSFLGEFKATITGLNINTSYYVRAYATNSLGTGYGDVVAISVGECSTFPMPFKMDFTNEALFPPPCWSALDHDGDGHGWFRNSYSAFGDKFAALSLTRIDKAGLSPYNILVTPKIRISGTNPTIQWSVRATDDKKYAEHYKLVISEVPITDSNCEDANIVKTLFEETLTQYDYYYWAMGWSRREYTHLEDYKGKDVYFAWVHYSCSNLSGIYIADINIFESSYPTVHIPFYETFSDGAKQFPPKGWDLLNFNTESYGWSFNWKTNGKTAAVSSSSKESVWNIIITPQLAISGSNPKLSWTVESSSAFKPYENYKVVISQVPITEQNAKDRNVVKTLFEETLDQNAVNTPQNRSVNLSSYINQPVYIGWVHYDCQQASLSLYNIKLE